MKRMHILGIGVLCLLLIAAPAMACSITIVKDTDPDSGLNFAFGASVSPTLFFLDDDKLTSPAPIDCLSGAASTANCKPSRKFLTSSGSTYKFQEKYANSGGYELVSIICTASDGHVDSLLYYSADGINWHSTFVKGQDKWIKVVMKSEELTCTFKNKPACVPCTEICDGKDNDCDGAVDEGFNVGASCTVGQGECEADGFLVCKADHSGTECNAVPGQPDTEICDGKDNDCDGKIDEELGSTPTSCGVGECAATGERICLGGKWVDTCKEGTPKDELCNCKDDDCDGFTDEDLSIPTTCGTDPLCLGQGVIACSATTCDWAPDTCVPKNDVPCTGGTCDHGVCVEEPSGCTYTQGYWKNHEDAWPGSIPPTTDFYDNLCTPDVGSWMNVLWTSAGEGPNYYPLAHQFIAAKLNMASGASTPDLVDDALAYGNTFFSANCPVRKTGPAECTEYYTCVLDQYNCGLSEGGPGHCDGYPACEFEECDEPLGGC